MKFEKQTVTLNWITPNPIKHIAHAAKKCYRADLNINQATDEEIVTRLVKNNHLSVIEHACASFDIICDRGISHEIVRHRIASYTQESTRYCNYNKDKFGNEITYIMPFEGISDNMMASLKFSEERYMEEINSGVKPEIARDGLPHLLKTELTWTANFLEWAHVIKLRSSKAAHPRFRLLVKDIQNILVAHCPEVFSNCIN